MGSGRLDWFGLGIRVRQGAWAIFLLLNMFLGDGEGVTLAGSGKLLHRATPQLIARNEEEGGHCDLRGAIHTISESNLRTEDRDVETTNNPKDHSTEMFELTRLSCPTNRY
ncbi:hypothetical protein CDL15_Pgr024011 [Punica granatum]|uniref:Uncharacterized protein n=1 Tax=Punica granatum TaxID=22663 RepID=A0A218XVJ8_PUNGR|nr:hypothetical protein CDL15_Pgr024011 [Punica granatum]